MYRLLGVSIIIGMVLLYQSCVEPVKPFHSLPPGTWRGVLYLDRTPVEKFGDDRGIVKKFNVDSELPFNFDCVL